MEFKEIPKAYLDVSKKYAIAKANSDMLDESKHSVLATEASIHDGSEAMRNRQARKSDKYKNYLVAVQQAKQIELELKHELISLQMEFDYYRSKQSTERAKMNLL